jgi:hypothetical protein
MAAPVPACPPARAPAHSDDYTYALERDRKPAKQGRSRAGKGVGLREGVLCRGAHPTDGNSSIAGLQSLGLSNATSLNSTDLTMLQLGGDDGACARTRSRLVGKRMLLASAGGQ